MPWKGGSKGSFIQITEMEMLLEIFYKWALIG